MMKEGIPYKLDTQTQTKTNSKLKMIPTFLVTIITLLILTTFIAMSSNVGQVEATTVIDPNCGVLDQKPSGKCDVDIDYDGKCSPSSRNCNIRYRCCYQSSSKRKEGIEIKISFRDRYNM